jgi:hypothetical protein
VARLYPQALGFIFVASYDSQGYGGGIRPHLHTGYNENHLRVFTTSLNPITSGNQALYLVTIIHSSEISVTLYQSTEPRT